MSLDDEWSQFLNCTDKDQDNGNDINTVKDLSIINESNIPKCSDIYISTKTKIIYLNTNIDIYNIFWKIPIIDYDVQEEGIIKKQIKISSVNRDEVSKIDELLHDNSYVINKVINHIDNPDGRIKFKDIRKISVGIAKKDLIYTRVKEKSAFYNCFVITLRILYNNKFKEFHVKIFNTGKLEIPGLQNDIMLNLILIKLMSILKYIMKTDIYYIDNKTENVLINSNFNCGFYINRETLFNILRYKYHINSCYDPCSYPGIQCVYYYDNINKIDIRDNININDIKNNNIQKISYMIFRTGSILIVGKCTENILTKVYNFVKNILIDEYQNIAVKNIDTKIENKPIKPVKFKRRYIYTQ